MVRVNPFKIMARGVRKNSSFGDRIICNQEGRAKNNRRQNLGIDGVAKFENGCNSHYSNATLDLFTLSC